MIDRQEMLEFAGELGLDPNVVEKDYVLGWMLAGISQHPRTRDAWHFKGGTCLKKCFFETYRFSEDLDFTLPDSTHAIHAQAVPATTSRRSTEMKLTLQQLENHLWGAEPQTDARK